jgi:L-2-hydroxyglutarate oxidase
MKRYDLVVLGGGIIGVATAWRLKQHMPTASILLVEKENRYARHQTGHNSGVIHAGVYYQPGSLKADFCRRGAAATFEFCREFSLPFEQCGKMLVATDEQELERMSDLEKRCGKNNIETERISSAELRQREPNIRGTGALFVPATGITDFPLIAEKMAEQFEGLGGEVRLGNQVYNLEESKDFITIETGSNTFETEYLVVCGGLMADRLARMMDIDIDFSIIPFRGEYYKLAEKHNHIVSHLVYPIPDPELPFLGVHLTRMIDGSVTVGPNAVLGLKREGYGQINLDMTDIFEMIRFPGFWRLLKENLSSGFYEMKDSVYKPGYLERVRKYCPDLVLSDLKPYPAGIRAQAVLADGSLVHDFLFAQSPRSLHVCNAPSPAATSALPIAEHLKDKTIEMFNL